MGILDVPGIPLSRLDDLLSVSTVRIQDGAVTLEKLGVSVATDVELAGEAQARAQGDAEAIATAEEYALAQANAVRALLGGSTPWAEAVEYLPAQEVGFGGSVYSADPPAGFDRVLASLPPVGRGDGTDADHDLLLQRRVGAARAVTGGQGKPLYTVTSQSDYVPGATPIVGTLRWAEAQCRESDGGRIIFDKTADFGAGAGVYRIKLLADFQWLAHNSTYDARGATVTITGGDGTYPEGGQPGKAESPVKTYSASVNYRGNIEAPTVINNVTGASASNVYTCVEDVSRTGSENNPVNAPARWWLQQAWTTGRTGIPQGAREVDPVDGKLYALILPLGGYTTAGDTGKIKLSTGSSTVRPGLDRHDLDPVDGHWEPVGKTGFTFYVGASTWDDFNDPATSAGDPIHNVIFEKLAIVSLWGGESNDTGTHRDIQCTWWARNIWFDRCLFTNPDKNHDQIWALGNFDSVTFSWCLFKQHVKAVNVTGTGGLVTPKVPGTTQTNPALVETYGAAAQGYSMWNVADNTTLYIDKLNTTRRGMMVDALAALGQLTGEMDHGAGTVERIIITGYDFSPAGHDRLTLATRIAPKKHIANSPFDGTGDPTGTQPLKDKTFQAWTLPKFPPGHEQHYTPTVDPLSGDEWLLNRITFDHCLFDELGFRGPEVSDFNMQAHVVNCVQRDYGSYVDTRIDPTDTTMAKVHPCVPFGLAPQTGAAMRTQKEAQLFVERTIFIPSNLSGSQKKGASTATGASAGYLRTSGNLLLNDATMDADSGPTFTPAYGYSPDVADTSLRDRVLEAAGTSRLWTFARTLGLTVADGSVTNAKVAADAAIALSKLATDPLARAGHTGVQASTTISDFAEAVDDRVADLIVAGTGLTKVYDDGAGTLTLASSASAATVAGQLLAAPTIWYPNNVNVYDAAVGTTTTDATTATLSTGSSAFATTSLDLTFPWPSTGAVDLELIGATGPLAASGTQQANWALGLVTEGVSAMITGSIMVMWSSVQSGYGRGTYRKRLVAADVGSPAVGASVTVRWMVRGSTTTAGYGVRLYAGGTSGSLAMRAYASL